VKFPITTKALIGLRERRIDLEPSIQFSLVRIVKAMSMVSKFAVQSISDNSFLCSLHKIYRQVHAFYRTRVPKGIPVHFTVGFPAELPILYYKSMRGIECTHRGVLRSLFLLSLLCDITILRRDRRRSLLIIL